MEYWLLVGMFGELGGVLLLWGCLYFEQVGVVLLVDGLVVEYEGECMWFFVQGVCNVSEVYLLVLLFNFKLVICDGGELILECLIEWLV